MKQIFPKEVLESTVETHQFKHSKKILCQLNEKELSLKNGFKGQLKKGMTLNAQFKLAERSLFDLLYDRVDDWFNPSQKDITSINN